MSGCKFWRRHPTTDLPSVPSSLFPHADGDWCPPPATLGGGQGPKPPTHYTSGVAFLVDLQRMVELATALGKTDDAAGYAAYREWVVDGFNAAWLQKNGTFGNANGDGLQTSNSAALFIGAADAAQVTADAQAALASDVSAVHASHWSTGIIGMRFLHAALVQGGFANLALDTLLQVDYPRCVACAGRQRRWRGRA